MPKQYNPFIKILEETIIQGKYQKHNFYWREDAVILISRDSSFSDYVWLIKASIVKRPRLSFNNPKPMFMSVWQYRSWNKIPHALRKNTKINFVPHHGFNHLSLIRESIYPSLIRSKVFAVLLVNVIFILQSISFLVLFQFFHLIEGF